MKLTVKTLKGTHFQIVAQPTDTVMAVKKNIEEIQGRDNYPYGQQLLIHSGKVLKDESTLQENKVSEDGFLVVMLSKSKPSSATGSSASQPLTPVHTPLGTQPVPAGDSQPTPVSTNTATTDVRSPRVTSEVYGQAASNLAPETNVEPVVKELLDMGGGNWDRDAVVRALRAAYNNPERAVDYLYSGIPEAAEVAVRVVDTIQAPISGATTQPTNVGALPVSGFPNTSPLNMFPEEIPSSGTDAEAGTLDFLRQSQQFQTLRAMVQANPQILQPMLQELGKQNPQMMRLLQEHQEEFLQLLNESVEGVEGDLFDQPVQGDLPLDLPLAVNVTPAEKESIERLEAMGFDRSRVIEAFLACDKNESLAANYLLEHAADED